MKLRGNRPTAQQIERSITTIWVRREPRNEYDSTGWKRSSRIRQNLLRWHLFSSTRRKAIRCWRKLATSRRSQSGKGCSPRSPGSYAPKQANARCVGFIGIDGNHGWWRRQCERRAYHSASSHRWCRLSTRQSDYPSRIPKSHYTVPFESVYVDSSSIPAPLAREPSNSEYSLGNSLHSLSTIAPFPRKSS